MIRSAAKATHDGSRPFPEIVGTLIDAGVEYYFVDYSQMRTTYYDGATAVACETPYPDMPPIGESFDVSEVKSAIADSQQKGQSHRDFSRRVMVAGVLGYFAFLKGKRVTYFGRQGDQHTEWFPGARPGT